MRNTLALFLSTGVQRLATFVLTLYIARTLGAGALGQFSIVMSLVIIFQTLSFLGQEQIITREVARTPESAGDYLANGSLIVAGGGFVGMLLMIVAANLIRFESNIMTYAYVASLSLIPGALAIAGEAVIQGQERMHYVTVAAAISGAITLILAISLLNAGIGLWSVFLVLALANSARYVTYLFTMRHLRWHHPPRLNRTLIRHLSRLAAPFVIISIFGVVFKQVDVLLLGKLTDAAAVGIYSAGLRLVQIGMLFLPPLMLSLFPRMADVHVHSPERLKNITEQALKLLMTLIIPAAVIITYLADQLVLFFYGADYQESVSVLRILIWMLVLFFANGVLFRTMVASDNERVTLRVAGVNMVCSVTLNLLLIPLWGVYAVAVVSLLTTLVGLLQNYAYIARHLFTLNWLRLIGKPVLAAVLLAGLLIVLHGTPLALSLPLGMALYCAAILGLRVFSTGELEFVRRSWADAKTRISL
jgi:O-antigen/teichoic acid export membrane protein